MPMSALTDPGVPQAAAAAGAGGHGAPGHVTDHLLAADPRPGPGGVSLHHQVVTAASSGQCGTKVTGDTDDEMTQELDGDVCLHDHIHDCGEISVCCSPSLHSEK